MLEDPTDRIGGNSLIVHGIKLAVWEKMIFNLRIMGAWQVGSFNKELGSLNSSRTNKGAKAYREEGNAEPANNSRIDRFYISDFFRELGGQQSIMSGTTLSDHFPIILNVQEGKKPGQMHKKIPDSIFLGTKLAIEVKEIWQLHMEQQDNSTGKVTNALNHLSFFFRE